MSKGTPLVAVRIPADLKAEIELTISRRNFYSKNEPWDLSAFLRIACREKIRKMERSRRRASSAQLKREELNEFHRQAEDLVDDWRENFGALNNSIADRDAIL